MTHLELTRWRKASRSGADHLNCVELATTGRELGVRDSKRPAAGALVLPDAARAALLAFARR